MSVHEPGQPVAILPSGPLDAEVEAPPSKSLTIRALATAALAAGRSALRRPLLSDDTERMTRALGTLGIETSRRGSSMIVVGRGGGLPVEGAALDLGHAGTPLRLLTAICCLGRGRFVLDGSPRMRQRPMADLIEALASLGVHIVSMNSDGCPPVEIRACGLSGGRVRLRGSVSSQFLSALLIVGPCACSGLEIEVDGTLVSRPYVDLTIQVMESFGARIERDGFRWFRAEAGHPYQARVFPVEGDASSASYFFAAAAVTGGRVRVSGIPYGSSQGDLGLLDLLEEMGCRVDRRPTTIEVVGVGPLAGIDADLTDLPDMAPTLAVMALFAGSPTTLRGVGHLRFKESDRIERVAACVRALGGAADTGADWLRIRPPAAGQSGLRGADIDPRDDHRIAMAFSVAGLAVPGVRILDPGCVTKSFPGFFDHLGALPSA